MTLSAASLRRLTQIKQKAKLKRWLRDNGVLFMEDANGWPITTEAAIQRVLDGKAAVTPNWQAYENRIAKGRASEARVAVPRTQEQVALFVPRLARRASAL